MSQTLTSRSVLLLRIGLLGAGIVLLSASSDLRSTVPTSNDTIGLIIPSVALASAVFLVVSSLLPQPRLWMRWLVLMAILGAMASYAYVQFTLYSPLFWTRTDNEMIGEYAVEVLQSGQNPYTWDYSDMTRVFRDRGNRTTQFLDNSTQRRVTYPAFPTLLLATLDSMGMGQVRVMSFLFLTLLLIMMFVGVPPDYRPVVLLPLFVQKDFIILSLIGTQDVVWSMLLVAMILVWRQPITRAVLFGLAANFRQQPWFIMPFLLLLLWHEGGGTRGDRFQRIAVFSGIAGGLFVAFNLPFLLWNPEAWILGVLEPAYASFNVFSQGFAALTQYGVLSLTREYYSVLHLGMYSCLLFVGWRHFRVLGQAFWVLPALFFWVYYRGLANYWLYWLSPLLIGFMIWRNKYPQPQRVVGWKPTALVGGGFALVMVLLATMPMFRTSDVSIEVLSPDYPISTGEPQVQHLRLLVTNTSTQRFRPRFSVQYERVTETYPWLIDTGPDWLEPGESAEYEITTNGVPSKSFTPQRGAQVVVSDASLDYRFRAVTNVPSPNDASEIFWPNNGPVPFGELADGRNRMYQVLENPSAYYVNLGDGYRAHGDVNAAEQAYAEALAHNPENQQALTGLAQLRQMSREDDD